MFNENSPLALLLPVTLLVVGLFTGNPWVIGLSIAAIVFTALDL